MSNVVAIQQFNPDQIQLIKNTVAKGATDDELKMFLYLAKEYGLDPFKKEMWFIKRVKKVKDSKGNWNYPKLPNGEIDYSGAETVIMTSRDGYLKFAQSSPEYEGLTSMEVRENDQFEYNPITYEITHKIGAKSRGKIMGAWARCDRKGMKPFIAYVEFEEYKGEGPIWNKYPSAMIKKVAEVLVLKRAFGINGMTTKEEMDQEEPPEIINIIDTGQRLTAIPQTFQVSRDEEREPGEKESSHSEEPIFSEEREAKLNLMTSLLKEANIIGTHAVNFIKKHAGRKDATSKDITEEEIDKVVVKVEERLNQQKEPEETTSLEEELQAESEQNAAAVETAVAELLSSEEQKGLDEFMENGDKFTV